MKDNALDVLVACLGDRMLAANAALLARQRGRASFLAFLSDDDDAILAPFVLLSIHMDRQEVSRLAGGTPAERKRAAAYRRKLLEELTAYATPKAARRKPRGEQPKLPAEQKHLRFEIARTRALLDFLERGEKVSVALARHAAELGVVAPKPEAKYPSRAAQRAEQRRRKKAGEPPRPRGRPARPR